VEWVAEGRVVLTVHVVPETVLTFPRLSVAVTTSASVPSPMLVKSVDGDPVHVGEVVVMLAHRVAVLLDQVNLSVVWSMPLLSQTLMLSGEVGARMEAEAGLMDPSGACASTDPLNQAVGPMLPSRSTILHASVKLVTASVVAGGVTDAPATVLKAPPLVEHCAWLNPTPPASSLRLLSWMEAVGARTVPFCVVPEVERVGAVETLPSTM